MEVYTQSEENAVLWAEPIEGIWQVVPRGGGKSLAKKLPHLGLAEVLFIAAVVNIPRPVRPWGIITWLADVFRLSRVSVYQLGRRVVERLEAEPRLALPAAQEVEPSPAEAVIEVTANRVKRTILTGAFPGSMSIRASQVVLQAAFDQSRGIGTISQLLVQAGQQAGHILGAVDTSVLGPVILLRDETFFQERPILLLVEPVSSAIVLAVVSDDRQAETWGAALLLAQDQGLTIAGLVEDMARMYDPSLKLAELEIEVQKDPWHVQQLGQKVKAKLQRQAYRAIQDEEALTQQLLKAWSDDLFEHQYVPVAEQMDRLLGQLADFETYLDQLYDALELVDGRSGEIRDPATNAWLLDETISLLAQINHPEVKALVKTLRRHRPYLLTFLDWLNAALQPFEEVLAQLIPDPTQQRALTRTAARAWRLQQALNNGQARFGPAAHRAQEALNSLTANAPLHHLLVTHLHHILNTAIHTSSLIEGINSLLKSFLLDRKSLATLETAQAYLNLFTLWHNMRVYQRGKRAGYSPYQLAGIDLGSEDWLELLGFPAP